MYIEKRGNKYRYVERYIEYRTGKHRRVSVTLDKNTAAYRREAQRLLDEKIAKINDASSDRDYTIQQAVQLYLNHQSHVVKASTLKRNQSAMRNICSILGGDTIVSTLNARYINESLLSSGRSHKSLNEDITRLKAFIRWCYKNDIINDISYLEKIERFKIQASDESLKYLERDELNFLLPQLTIEINRLFITFLALSGLRIGEAVALEKPDVDTDRRLIHVTKTFDPQNKIITSTKTERSMRDVYIQDELMDLIETILNYYADNDIVSDLFFCTRDGRRIQYRAIEKYFRENCERILGRPMRIHSLRHTHASLLFEQGISLEAVSIRLGHANSRTTKDIYLHITQKKKDMYNEQIKGLTLLN